MTRYARTSHTGSTAHCTFSHRTIEELPVRVTSR